jgi:hypothetical protein
MWLEIVGSFLLERLEGLSDGIFEGPPVDGPSNDSKRPKTTIHDANPRYGVSLRV